MPLGSLDRLPTGSSRTVHRPTCPAATPLKASRDVQTSTAAIHSPNIAITAIPSTAVRSTATTRSPAGTAVAADLAHSPTIVPHGTPQLTTATMTWRKDTRETTNMKEKTGITTATSIKGRRDPTIKENKDSINITRETIDMKVVQTGHSEETGRNECQPCPRWTEDTT